MRVSAWSMAVAMVVVMLMAGMRIMGGVVRVGVHQVDFNRDSLARTARNRAGSARS
ncbi:MAG: hypothetical protein WA211_17770 [Candidatus Acidiferrales bacterium]